MVLCRLWVSHLTGGRETTFRGIFRTKSPLRIGSGGEPPLGAVVDLAVLRIKYHGLEVPYIPGSSLKGVFRNFAYTLVRTKGLTACENNDCMQRLKGRKGKEGEISCEEFYQKACLLCKIFGSQGYRSKITFFDAYPLLQEEHVLSLGVRPGVQIDRKAGAVVNRYDVEYIEPGTRFRFEIVCSNLPNYALGLLSKVLLALNDGEVRIGGFKSRGFGEVEIETLEFVSTEGKEMRALDSCDRCVELPLIQEDIWIARREKAWEVIKILAGIWDEFKG